MDGTEPERYEHIANAFNRALQILDKVAMPGTRGSNEIEILFHRCDPVTIEAWHASPSFTSVRKPDIIITSLAAAQRASGDLDMRWEEAVRNYAPRPPKAAFKWRDVLSGQELKLVKAPLEVPNEYRRRSFVPLPADARSELLSTQASPSEGEGGVFDAGDSAPVKNKRRKVERSGKF